MHGVEVFNLYLHAKEQYPDLDDWEPESVMAEYGEEGRDAIMVAKFCFTTRMPWEDMQVFEKTVVVLNGRPLFGDVMQDLDVREISFAVDMMKAIFPDELFNDVIAKYIAIEATHEGFVILPENLGFAQRFVPVIYLSREQEHVQLAYLEEVETYKQLLDRSEV